MSGTRARDPAQGEPGKKRGKREVRGEFAAAIREPALKEKAGAAWGRREPLTHEAIAVDPAPFCHGVIPDFLPCPGFLDGLQRELLDLDFHPKCNDLYKFKQVLLRDRLSASSSQWHKSERGAGHFQSLFKGLPDRS